MKVVIVGCGRTGPRSRRSSPVEGWDVTCVDDDETALGRLGDWRGGFVVGHGMDLEVLERAGIATADAAVVSTDGDNSNVVIGQVVQRRYELGCVVVRVLDPRRAEFYAERGLQTVCPTQTAIATLAEIVRSYEPSPSEAAATDVRDRRGRRQGRREHHALAAPHGPRGDADRAATRPVRAARGGARPDRACSATRPRSTCSSAPASRVRRRSCSR